MTDTWAGQAKRTDFLPSDYLHRKEHIDRTPTLSPALTSDLPLACQRQATWLHCPSVPHQCARHCEPDTQITQWEAVSQRQDDHPSPNPRAVAQVPYPILLVATPLHPAPILPFGYLCQRPSLICAQDPCPPFLDRMVRQVIGREHSARQLRAGDPAKVCPR